MEIRHRRKLFKHIRIRQSSRETESKWLQGDLRVTKLDLSKHVDCEEVNLANMTILCRHGYNFFFPSKSAKDDDQLMVVYYGSKFINKVAVPNCGLAKGLDDDSWDWNYLDVLDNGSENLILVGRSTNNVMMDQETFRFLQGRYNTYSTLI